MIAITEQTRNSSKAARGLNSIFNNLAQVLDDSSSNGKKITEIFNNLDVSMYDLNTGQLLSSYELLGNLAEKWDTLDTNTKNYIASTIAGTHQLNNFLALMNNFDHAIEATETALNSAGSAARENSRYMEGLEAKTQAVKASFQELANSVIDSGLVKGILDLANGFLQLLNTPIGNFITQMTLLTGVFWGGSGLIRAMKLIPSFFSTAATAINGFTGVLSLTAPQLMLVAAGISAILAIAPAISNWWKEFTGDVEYLNEKIGEYNNQLSTNKDRLKDLLSIPVSSRTEEIEDEIILLQMENEELENNIRLYKEKLNKSSLSDIRQQHWAGSGDTFTVVWEQSGEKAINETVSSVEEAIEKLKEYGYTYDGVGDKLEDFNVTLKESEDVLLSSDDYLEYLINNTDSLIKSFENVANASEEEKQSFIDTYKQIQAYADTLQYASENGEVLSEAEKDLIEYAKELENGYSDLLNQMYPVEDSLERLASGAALNANEFTNFVSVYPDLTDALEESNGLYKINQESLYNLAAQSNETARALIEAQIEATKQTIASTEKRIKTYMAELEALEKLSGQKILGAWGPSTPAGASANIMNMLMGEDGKSRADVLSDAIEQERNGLLEAKNDLADLLAQVDSWDPEVTGFDTNGDGKTSSSKEKDPIKEQSDNFKEYNENFEHYIFLREKQGASTKELISLNKEYQNQLKKEADWFRSQGVPEDSEYIRDLQKNWWGLQDTVIDLQRQSFDERLKISEDYIEDRNDLSDWGADSEIAAYQRVLDWMDERYKNDLIDYEYYWEKRKAIAKKQAKAIEESLEKIQENRIENIENQIKDMESLFSVIAEQAQKEIDILESQKEAIEQKYQAQIDAIEEANDELERQIELEEAMDALARARQAKVMVYKDGRFQYVEDIDQVSEAQSNLDRLQREEQKRKDIEALEAQRDTEIKLIDESIKYWEDYVKKYGDYVDDFAEEQERKLLEQKYGIKLEGENWELSLKQFEDYIKEYKKLQEELTSLESMGNISSSGQDWSQIWLDADKAYKDGLISKEEADAIKDYAHSQKEQEMAGSGATFNPSSGEWTSSSSSSSSNKTDWSQVWKDAQKDYESGKISEAEKNKIQNEAHKNKQEEMTGSGATFNPASGKWQYASGTTSAYGGLSLVGENGPELRLLNKGDGILPSDITKNLWAWGVTTPSSMIHNILNGLQSMGQQIGITIQNFNPNLPNVKDGQGFATYMRNNFWREAIQFAKT